jgi:hypothetical protein
MGRYHGGVSIPPTSESPEARRISTLEIVQHGLPDGATGVSWVTTQWTECRAHVDDPSWTATVERCAHRDGEVLFGPVVCDWPHEGQGL